MPMALVIWEEKPACRRPLTDMVWSDPDSSYLTNNDQNQTLDAFPYPGKSFDRREHQISDPHDRVLMVALVISVVVASII